MTCHTGAPYPALIIGATLLITAIFTAASADGQQPMPAPARADRAPTPAPPIQVWDIEELDWFTRAVRITQLILNPQALADVGPLYAYPVGTLCAAVRDGIGLENLVPTAVVGRRNDLTDALASYGVTYPDQWSATPLGEGQPSAFFASYFEDLDGLERVCMIDLPPRTYLATTLPLPELLPERRFVTIDGAARLYRIAAQDGDPMAQFALGTMYRLGQGVSQDDTEAVVWLRRSAEQGFAPAQHNLAMSYAAGEGLEVDNVEAVRWLRRSAAGNFAPAQHNLAVSYWDGVGVEQSYQEAITWFGMAAEQGFAPAQHNLAISYWNGDGVEQNYDTAVTWFRRAAEQGDGLAQFGLAVAYSEGLGVERDEGLALEWLNQAVGRLTGSDRSRALELRDTLAELESVAPQSTRER